MARTKFLSADTDTTLGGSNASHEYVPSQKAVKEYVDGRPATLPAEDYHSYSANETSIVFGSVYSYHEVEVTGSTQTFNINIPTANTYVNYLLVKNSGSGTCTIALAAASGMAWTSFVLPSDAIEVDAGECIELSFISIDNHTRLVVTKSAALEITTLS